MRLYEYEAKKLFEANGLPIPVQYGVIRSVAEFEKLPVSYPVMLKAGVLIGGRGKAGGVKKVGSLEEAKEVIPKMLGLKIKDYPVETLAVEKAGDGFTGACYIGCTMDPKTFRPIMIVSSAGGVEIEEVAKTDPDAILRHVVYDNEMTLPESVAVDLATKMFKDSSEKVLKSLAEVIAKVYAMFQGFDARVVEINPLLVSSDGVLAVDAKVVLDDNALFRQGEALRSLGIHGTKRHDVSEPSANEKRSIENKFPYVDLLAEGEKKDPEKLYVGLVPGGAGYGIFSIDEVANVGERFFDNRVIPVNFMDSGGGPPLARVAEMFHLMMDYDLVDLIITSRFGGISSCDVFIRGLIHCLRERFNSKRRIVPVFGRMVGTDLPSARANLEKALLESPEPLKDMHIIVGNQRIMVDVIREGVSYAFERKGWALPAGADNRGKVVESEDVSGVFTGQDKIGAHEGMLWHIVKKRRPELAEYIRKTGNLESIVVGLGGAGTRHAGLMQKYGSQVVAGVAAGRGGTRIHETIPVYDSVKEAVAEHPHIVAASIWRQYVTARDAALEVIEAGIPLVVLITEFVPLRDVRDILVAAKKHGTLLIGGNTPGVIFPPEGIKVGMLPDVFYPEEPRPGVFGPKGVTIISRSGAILYHMSDALASVGIAQNAVLGVGGDGANGSTFRDLVPIAMEYPGTDLVVVAGEIGGMQEELLAQDIKDHPERYPKPLVAMISGKHAPEGKTMGHAGAIVAPGQAFGTWQSKHDALSAAGVPVVNSQYDLRDTVVKKLGGKVYFDTKRYYGKMKLIWEAPAPKPSWGTVVTNIEPNSIQISGYPLQEIIPRKGYLETAWLLVKGEFPNEERLKGAHETLLSGAAIAAPSAAARRNEGEDISKVLAKCFLVDDDLASFPQSGVLGPVTKTMYGMGRALRYLSASCGNEAALDVGVGQKEAFSSLLLRAVVGVSQKELSVSDQAKGKLLEALVVASVDHGVTPPSAQATLIASSVRAAYEVSVAAGVAAITDVHGGAGAKAAVFFMKVAELMKKEKMEMKSAAKMVMTDYIRSGKRVEGMGHRVHTKDPRREALWQIADSAGAARENVAISKVVEEVFAEVRGMKLPINVDGVIGAIVADIGLDPVLAKSFFILGRIAGLSAHYFEEISSQSQMRRINFAEAVYKGHSVRHLE